MSEIPVEKTETPPLARRPYQPPRLESYGGLAELTQAFDKPDGKNDSSMGSFKT